MTANNTNNIDDYTTMLAHLVCADASVESSKELSVHKARGLTEVDTSFLMPFCDEHPTHAYAASLSGEDRIFATDACYLLRAPQETIGNRTEIALLSGATVKWSCFKKIHKRPHRLWVARAGADLYEYHARWIQANGQSFYAKRVVAIDRLGRPVPTAVEGVRNGGAGKGASICDGTLLVLAASIMEDAHRSGVFTATVKDHCAITVPVPDGEHLDVFKLRDGPLIPGSQRKRAILHWVARHIRRQPTGISSVVKSHLRGVHEFDVDGLHVRLVGGHA